jgi:hypothetical protein
MAMSMFELGKFFGGNPERSKTEIPPSEAEREAMEFLDRENEKERREKFVREKLDAMQAKRDDIAA